MRAAKNLLEAIKTTIEHYENKTTRCLISARTTCGLCVFSDHLTKSLWQTRDGYYGELCNGCPLDAFNDGLTFGCLAWLRDNALVANMSSTYRRDIIIEGLHDLLEIVKKEGIEA